MCEQSEIVIDYKILHAGSFSELEEKVKKLLPEWKPIWGYIGPNSGDRKVVVCCQAMIKRL